MIGALGPFLQGLHQDAELTSNGYVRPDSWAMMVPKSRRTRVPLMPLATRGEGLSNARVQVNARLWGRVPSSIYQTVGPMSIKDDNQLRYLACTGESEGITALTQHHRLTITAIKTHQEPVRTYWKSDGDQAATAYMRARSAVLRSTRLQTSHQKRPCAPISACANATHMPCDVHTGTVPNSTLCQTRHGAARRAPHPYT
jgi:hypothetical protein